jgi:hypothetical protein
MKELLFEDPMPIYVVLGILEIIMAAVWYRGRVKRVAIALAVPPLLAGVFLAMDVLVVTDREKLDLSLREIATDLQRGDIQAATQFLSDDFGGYYNSPKGAAEACEKAMRMYGIKKVSVSDVRTELYNESMAKVQARTFVDFDVPGFGQGRQAIDWTIHWALRNGQWKIIEVDEPKMLGAK